MTAGTATFAALGAGSLALGVAGMARAAQTFDGWSVSPDCACYGLAVVFLLGGFALGRRFS